MNVLPWTISISPVDRRVRIAGQGARRVQPLVPVERGHRLVDAGPVVLHQVGLVRVGGLNRRGRFVVHPVDRAVGHEGVGVGPEELEGRCLVVRQQRDRQVVLAVQRRLQRAGTRPRGSGRREDAVVPALDREPQRSVLAVPGRERAFGCDDGVATRHPEENERQPVAERGLHRLGSVVPQRGGGPIAIASASPVCAADRPGDTHRQLKRPGDAGNRRPRKRGSACDRSATPWRWT